MKEETGVTGKKQWVDRYEYKRTFATFSTGAEETFANNRVEAHLTLDGLDYAIKLKRESEQHQSIITTNNSVRGTNTKTWIIALLAAMFAGMTFLKDCKRDNHQVQQLKHIKDQLTRQLQDSSRQIRETVEVSAQRLQYQIDTILKTKVITLPGKTPNDKSK